MLDPPPSSGFFFLFSCLVDWGKIWQQLGFGKVFTLVNYLLLCCQPGNGNGVSAKTGEPEHIVTCLMQHEPEHSVTCLMQHEPEHSVTCLMQPPGAEGPADVAALL